VKSAIGRAVYKSTEIREREASYNVVASEYYDADLHPTCADFRAASYLYLEKLFGLESPHGRIADVGCGRSLVAEFVSADNLVLVDESQLMLQDNVAAIESRIANIEIESFGYEEFGWVFAILGDPYNTAAAWKHISEALRPGGNCIFIVPSIVWATKFREGQKDERNGLARFVTSGGRSVYLRSLIFSAAEQQAIISEAGLSFVGLCQVLTGELKAIKSAKISEHLSARDPLLDIYRAHKL
jgi:SAM-dependent methyltransferase